VAASLSSDEQQVSTVNGFGNYKIKTKDILSVKENT